MIMLTPLDELSCALAREQKLRSFISPQAASALDDQRQAA